MVTEMVKSEAKIEFRKFATGFTFLATIFSYITLCYINVTSTMTEVQNR